MFFLALLGGLLKGNIFLEASEAVGSSVRVFDKCKSKKRPTDCLTCPGSSEGFLFRSEEKESGGAMVLTAEEFRKQWESCEIP